MVEVCSYIHWFTSANRRRAQHVFGPETRWTRWTRDPTHYRHQDLHHTFPSHSSPELPELDWFGRLESRRSHDRKRKTSQNWCTSSGYGSKLSDSHHRVKWVVSSTHHEDMAQFKQKWELKRFKITNQFVATLAIIPNIPIGVYWGLASILPHIWYVWKCWFPWHRNLNRENHGKPIFKQAQIW